MSDETQLYGATGTVFGAPRAEPRTTVHRCDCSSTMVSGVLHHEEHCALETALRNGAVMAAVLERPGPASVDYDLCRASAKPSLSCVTARYPVPMPLDRDALVELAARAMAVRTTPTELTDDELHQIGEGCALLATDLETAKRLLAESIEQRSADLADWLPARDADRERIAALVAHEELRAASDARAAAKELIIADLEYRMQQMASACDEAQRDLGAALAREGKLLEQLRVHEGIAAMLDRQTAPNPHLPPETFIDEPTVVVDITPLTPPEIAVAIGERRATALPGRDPLVALADLEADRQEVMARYEEMMRAAREAGWAVLVTADEDTSRDARRALRESQDALEIAIATAVRRRRAT